MRDEIREDKQIRDVCFFLFAYVRLKMQMRVYQQSCDELECLATNDADDSGQVCAEW